MRHLQRQHEPPHLTNNKATWLRTFLARRAKNSSYRPPSAQYGHENIRRVLKSMSHGKCFYCEAMLKDGSNDVEHFIEVSIDPNKAFNWDNLYLSCKNCNTKMTHNEIPVTQALDPCNNTDADIEAAIYFEDEYILSVVGSAMGDNTILKYRLDSEKQENLRRKHLQRVNKIVIRIQRNMIRENRKLPNPEEQREIDKLKSIYSPYSLMVKQYLRQCGF